MPRKRKRSRRFPLLVYAPLGRRLSGLGFLLAVASLALWWIAPRALLPPFNGPPFRHLILLPVLVGGSLFVYGLAARQLAYVQCFPTYFRIQTPFYPLVVSYRRVAGTRPVQVAKAFDREKDRAARRSWPERYWAMTGLAVELRGYPVSQRWLRFWLDRHLFLPDGTGFLFIVDDWLELSRELDGFLALYRAQRQGVGPRARGRG